MPSNEQPSILTVCVTGAGSEDGALELKDILAARELAIATSTCSRGDAGNSPRGDSTAKCDACDDSACGMDLNDSSTSKELTEGRGNDDLLGSNPSFFHADSGKKALELLRMLRFDLLVTSNRLPDMPVGQLIRRVRAAWPWQKWAMVGVQMTTDDEVAARTLGAMAVFDAPPDWNALGELAEAAAVRAATPAIATLAAGRTGLHSHQKSKHESGMSETYQILEGADRLTTPAERSVARSGSGRISRKNGVRANRAAS